MRFIQTKAILENGQLVLDKPIDKFPTEEQNVDVIIVFKKTKQPEKLDEIRNDMQTAFKEAGIATREQVLQVIKEVKQELFQERHAFFFRLCIS